MQSASLSYAAAACPPVPIAPNDCHVKKVNVLEITCFVLFDQEGSWK